MNPHNFRWWEEKKMKEFSLANAKQDAVLHGPEKQAGTFSCLAANKCSIAKLDQVPLIT